MSISFINRKSGGGGGDGSTLNIFTQLAEPAVKKGLWLQTENEFEHVYGDDDVVEIETWLPDGTIRNIPYSFYYGSVNTIGTDIYLIGGDWNQNVNNNYKYDTLTNTYTKLANLPYDFYGGTSINIGTDIYIFGSYYDNNKRMAYKYDTLTNTYTKLTNIPYDFYYGKAISIGTDIYLLGGADTNFNNYKYDILTDTYTKMTNIPYSFSKGTAVNIGTDIYLFGSHLSSDTKTAYKYDTVNNTYTKLANIPGFFSFGCTVAFGTDVYLFGCYTNDSSRVYNTLYKYDSLNNTYTQLDDSPYEFYNSECTVCSNNIYIFGIKNNHSKVECMRLALNNYEDNSIVISQGRLYNVGYVTEIFSNNLASAPLLYALADAWFYTTQDGLITNIPTYYGNGTQWINIKNPPQQE